MSVPGGDAGRSLAMGGKRPFELGDLVDAGAYVVDDGGRIMQVNPRAEQLLRRGAEELVGRDAHDLLHRGEHGQPLPRSHCEMRGPLLTGDSAQGVEQWLERGDGTLMKISWLVTPCQGDDPLTSALVIFHEAGSGEDETGPRAPSPVHTPMSERDRLALLAETTTTLTSSLDVAETLRQLVRLVVPLLADWVVIDLFTEEGSVSREVVVHFENGTLTHRDELEELLPPLARESPMPLARALRGVAAALVGPEDYRGRPDSAITAAQQHLMEVTGIRSACIAPIRGVREVVGAVTLGRSERAEPFTTDDMLLTEDIARRAGLALDNARLYERQRRVAETMQRHLLPQLPTVPGLEMRACYVPAPDASQVGGDWYDAFLMSDGSAGLVIGDVVGHDLDAAAGMAQVCNMLRAYAGELEEPPSMVIDRLDQAVARMADPTMATVVFARAEHANGGWQLRWTNAGHPPPLLVESDGRAVFLEDASGLLLGTGHRLPREDAVVPLPPGSTVLFYTDGLIESPSHSLDDGLERLSTQAAGLVGQPLTAFCDRFLAGVRPADNDDDVALLVLRIPG